MWTIDCRCDQCKNRPGPGRSPEEPCADREKLLRTITALTGELNLEEPYASSPGNGKLIVACADFAIA